MPTPSLGSLYRDTSPGLIAHLSRCFPHMCPGLRDDAVQDTWLALVEHPDRFDAQLQRGQAEVDRLLQVVAWRSMRSRYRKASYQREQGGQIASLTGSIDGPPDELADLPRRMERAIEEAVQTHGGRRPERLERALRDRLQGGETDGAVAKRHGLHRSTLCRAKNLVRQLLRSD